MDPTKLKGFVTKGLHPKYDDGVHVTGFLGEEAGGKHRIYPSLDDRSHYIEVSAADIEVVIKHPHGDRVTVTLKPEAPVRIVQGDERAPAQFLRGELSRQHMGSAASPGPEGAEGWKGHPMTCHKPSNT